MPPPEPKEFVFLRGYLAGDTARPFVALATQDKEVVRVDSSAGLIFFGSASPAGVDDPGKYVGDHIDLNDVITTVGQVVDGVFTVDPDRPQSAISLDGYETLNIIGSTPNRSYQPYTPQFVDL